MKALVLSLCILFLYSCGDSPTEIEKKRIEALKEKEFQNPNDYLAIKASVETNLIGRKIASGNITNNASMVTYGDVEIMFHFVDSLGKDIDTRLFKCREYIAPGKKISFQLKAFPPKETKQVKFTVSGKGTER